MSTDPYAILGVKKDATQDDLQKAYRRLAKKLHPDLNPGDKEAEDKFKSLSAAYDIVGDPDKRARFDKGEIDASGTERPQQRYYRDYADAGDAHAYSSSSGFSDLGSEDILSEILGRAGRADVRMRGQDARYRLQVDFLDAVNRASRQVTLPDGSELNVTIPAGTRDGQILRLRGKGGPGYNGGPPGDALVEIDVGEHRDFRRAGDDIHLDLPVSLTEAVLGAKVGVPTPTGPVTMTVPKGANSGTVLRLRGKGVARRDGGHGDQYVTLRVMLPEKPDAALESFVAGWSGKSYNPRQGLES